MCGRLGQEAATRSPHPDRADWPFASRHPIRQVEARPSLGSYGGARLTVTHRCGNVKPALRVALAENSRADADARAEQRSLSFAVSPPWPVNDVVRVQSPHAQ
jgi:hypothetical protein